MTNQKSKQLSRRKVLKQILGTGVCIPCVQFLSLVPTSAQSRAPEHPAASPSLSQEDDKFLSDLENRNLQYFWAQANQNTGVSKDMALRRHHLTTTWLDPRIWVPPVPLGSLQ